MAEYGPGDMTVVIPTRDRWPVLVRTLRGLEDQTAPGFAVTVVVDGEDQQPPRLPGVRVLVRRHEGPGAARNAAVHQARTPLVMFLGDDIIPRPDVVERHLRVHNRRPERHVGVLGRIEWHPELGADRMLHWLDWSGSQFDYRAIAGDDAGWGRFYSSQVSLKRDFFLEAGGFDPDFTFDYEDLDLGWRLGRLGLRLVYEPAALGHHLHPYSWEGLRRRYESRARAERLMAAKHEWFQPFFGGRVRDAANRRPVSPLWPLLVDHIPARPAAVRRIAQDRADRWYHRRVGPAYLDAWEGARDLEDLKAYLGDAYDERHLRNHRRLVDEEEERAASQADFYRTSQAYLYDLTAFAMSGTKRPYIDALVGAVPRGARLLDYGCGIGADGLRLLERGYRVGFADFDNPSVAFLRWRLARRGLTAEIHDIEKEVPGGYDAAYAFDVIEHVDDPIGFLAQLEQRATLVCVNLLEPASGDTHLHKPLPIPALLDRAADRGLVRYRVEHGRSHLVIYRSGRRGRSRPTDRFRSATDRFGSAADRFRSATERRWGPAVGRARHRMGG